MLVASEACNRIIDVTLEYQTAPLLEMQQKLAESEKENAEEGKENKESEEAEESQNAKAESTNTTLRVSFSIVVYFSLWNLLSKFAIPRFFKSMERFAHLSALKLNRASPALTQKPKSERFKLNASNVNFSL